MKKTDLSKFHELDCSVKYEDIVKTYGKKTVIRLKQPNVSPHSDRKGRATPYRLGWTASETGKRNILRSTVWNKTNWQLTHLLENGHFITNIEGDIAWSAPRPHIKPTFDAMKPKYIRDMRKAKIDISIK